MPNVGFAKTSESIPTHSEGGYTGDVHAGGVYKEKYRFVVDLDEIDEAYQRFVEMYEAVDRTFTISKGIPGKRYMGGISMDVQGMNKIAKNLHNLGEGVATQIRLRFIDLARQILKQAVQWAPVESGQLRESAEARVGGRLIARGTNSGTVGDIVPIAPDSLRESDQLSINISFSDENRKKTTYRDKKTGVVRDRKYATSDDFLVSTWVHENLHYKSQTSGTGSKYLERAFMQATGDVLREVEAAVALGMVESSGGYWRK